MFNDDGEVDKEDEEKNNETGGVLDLTQLTSVAQLKVQNSLLDSLSFSQGGRNPTQFHYQPAVAVTSEAADISQDVDRLNAVINQRLEALASSKAANETGLVTDQTTANPPLLLEQNSNT